MTEPEGLVDEGPWNGQTDEQSDDGPDAKPGRSTIRFPYADLKSAARVPAVIKNNFGAACDIDQLAAQLQQSAKSGAFRTRVAAAVAFGLVTSRRNRVTITKLGHLVAGGDRAALATAFLNAELYRKIFDAYRGNTLPADAGLTAHIREMGVLASQADRARQVMQRSAEYAGFFHAGRDRLVEPPTGTLGGEDPQGSQGKTDAGNAGGGGGQNMANNPLLQGLWGMLPSDGDFPADKRAQWFRALAVNLDLVYGESHLDVQIKQLPPAQGAQHVGQA